MRFSPWFWRLWTPPLCPIWCNGHSIGALVIVRRYKCLSNWSMKMSGYMFIFLGQYAFSHSKPLSLSINWQNAEGDSLTPKEEPVLLTFGQEVQKQWTILHVTKMRLSFPNKISQFYFPKTIAPHTVCDGDWDEHTAKIKRRARCSKAN